jgi:phenylacetate-CoA ligase
MSFLEIVRKNIFWFIDNLQGGAVRKHYSDVIEIIEHGSTTGPITRKNELLDKLLFHAKNTTDFYKGFPESCTLPDFPVINKAIIRNSFDQFISQKYRPDQLIPVVTSGSTGTPFKVFHDRNKKIRNYADTVYFAKLAGYQIGDRLLYLKIWAKQKMKNPLSYWMQNLIPVDVIKLNDAQVEDLIRKMKTSRSTFGFLGYSSALEVVCKYLDKIESGRINANVSSIISMSETLNDYTKESMQKYFGVPAVSRYSNLENGIIAQQEINSEGRYLVNTASYYVEVLKMDSDNPADYGQLGRIVVTDLFNYAMPLIRYDTGDIGALTSDTAKPGNLYFSIIEGRKLDLLFDTTGNLVSSYIVYKNMWQYTEIIQYQLIQEGEKEYIFKINTDGVFIREEQLIKEFKKYLGEDAEFTVEYVSEIPLLHSGKRKKIVNNYRH